MEEVVRVGYDEEKPGVLSSMRRNIRWYFWYICFPGSIAVLYAIVALSLDNNITISDGFTLVLMFLILQLGWIAPKQLSKITETVAAMKDLKQ